MKCIRSHYLLILLLCIDIAMFSQAPDLDFELIISSGLTDPVDIASRRDGSGRLFIAEKGGDVRIVQNGALLGSIFLDVDPIYTVGECGLLGIAFHPDTSVNYVYVYYTLGNPRRSLVARFSIDPNNPNDALEDSEYNIITVDQIAQDNHKAGDLAFGPDGYLYITLGDGGGTGDPGENGQDGLELLGKILRIDVDNTEGSLHYAIPDDNPFVNDPNVRDEIWDMGMRNPWRISFDRETGDFWIGDVGQGIWEEIDFEPAGSGGGFNYGWDCYEGNATYETSGCLGMSNYDFPIFVYPHSCLQGPCPYGTGNSITGGFVYRGAEFEDLQGYYICADYGSENIWLILNPDGDTSITMQSGGSLFQQLTSFGEDDNGELYAVTLQDRLYRVIQDGVLPVYLTHFEAISSEKVVDLRWRVDNVADITMFTLERSENKTFFSPIGNVTPDPLQGNYTFTDPTPLAGLSYYRLVYSLKDGGAQISGVRAVDRTHFDITSEVLTRADGGLSVQIVGDILSSRIAMYAPDGRLMHIIQSEDQSIDVPGSSDLQTGVYVVVVETDLKTWVHKWFKG